jgi:hypothetical protein
LKHKVEESYGDVDRVSGEDWNVVMRARQKGCQKGCGRIPEKTEALREERTNVFIAGVLGRLYPKL